MAPFFLVGIKRSLNYFERARLWSKWCGYVLSFFLVGLSCCVLHRSLRVDGWYATIIVEDRSSSLWWTVNSLHLVNFSVDIYKFRCIHDFHRRKTKLQICVKWYTNRTYSLRLVQRQEMNGREMKGEEETNMLMSCLKICLSCVGTCTRELGMLSHPDLSC